MTIIRVFMATKFYGISINMWKILVRLDMINDKSVYCGGAVECLVVLWGMVLPAYGGGGAQRVPSSRIRKLVFRVKNWSQIRKDLQKISKLEIHITHIRKFQQHLEKVKRAIIY